MGVKIKPQDRIWFRNFKTNYKNELKKTDLEQIASLHSVYFGHSFYKPCTCNQNGRDEIKRWVQELDKLLLSED